MNLKEYAELHGLGGLLEAARRYLPTMPDPRDVEVVDISTVRPDPRVLGWAYIDKEGRAYVGFRTPDVFTFLHELIHLAGGDEAHAYNYVDFLHYAVNKCLPPFNLLDLDRLTLADINYVLKKFGFHNVEDYFHIVGVIPVIMVPHITPDGIRFSIPEGTPEYLVVEAFLVQIADELSYNQTLAGQIFEEIVAKLRRPE